MSKTKLPIFIMPSAGMDDYVFHYANSLVKNHRDVSIIIQNKTLQRFKKFLDPRISVIITKNLRTRDLLSPLAYLSIFSLSRKIINSGCKVFHLQNVGIWELILVILLKRKVKIVTTIHDPLVHITSKFTIYNFIENITKYTIKISDGIVVHSIAHIAKIKKLSNFKNDKIHVHMMGAHDYYKNFENKIDRKKCILFFGEIRPNKGCDLLVDAFLAIKDKIPEWSLTIAGKGYYWESISNKVVGETSIKPIIKFINDDEVADLFNSSEIVCTPYLNGSQSGVASLAGVFGVPLVSFRFGNMEEILTDNKDVIFTDKNNVESLSASLLELCNDNEKRIFLSKNITKTCSEHWNWDSISKELILFYKRFL
jgi:glycosyltransferase involved in cell wall biosynthesis